MVDRPGPTWLILTESHKAIHIEFDDVEGEVVMTFHVFRADQKGDDTSWKLWEFGGYWPLRDWQQVFHEISGDLFDDGSISWSTYPEKPAFYSTPFETRGLAVAFDTIYSFGMRHFDFYEQKYQQIPAEVIEISAEDTTHPTT